MTALTIAFESPRQPEVAALVLELDAHLDTLYPPDARYALDLTSVGADDLRLAIARDGDRRALGCGAIVLHGDYAEVKRMFVRPAARGRGIAIALVRHLAQEARERGVAELRLETGPRQPEAIALYEREGFERCGRFGDYPEHPLSIFMRKRLTPAT